MPRRKKSKARTETKVERPTVTLKQNGHVHGKFYHEGDIVRVSQVTRDYLLKTTPEVFI